MSTAVPIIRQDGEGQRMWFAGGGVFTWKATAVETDGAFILLEDQLVRGKTTPLHLHPEAHELTYVIDGEIEVQTDGQRARVRSGGVSFVPKGVAHAFIVVSAEARLIALQTPGAVGQAFYRGASEPAIDEDADTLDLARLQASAAADPRGITILGPSPFSPVPAR
jgi:quercetin dioxygenase-like cupin family protein